MKTRIEINASGVYPRLDIPPDVAKALSIEIERHMIGYGFTSIDIHMDSWPTQETT